MSAKEKTKPPRVQVTQDPERPVPRNILAASIIEIGRAMKSLTQTGGLTKEAVIVLAQHCCRSPYKGATKPGIADVRAVIESLENLEKEFIKRW